MIYIVSIILHLICLFLLMAMIIKQSCNIAAKRSNLNGTKTTRIALFLITLSYLLDISIRLFSDCSHVIIGTCPTTDLYYFIFLAIRSFSLYALYQFYRLFYETK